MGIKTEDLDLSDSNAIASHIRDMRNTAGWAILLNHANVEREKIIADGKAGRREEKTIKMWAVLDGFDRMFSLVAKLGKVGAEQDNDPRLEDKED
jgi:hypothetical protein